MDRLAQDLNLLADSALTTLKSKLSIIPGSSIVLRYIASSYQNDPVRSLFELLLLLFAIRYFLASKYSYSKQNYVRLNEDEVDELVREWEPEPLVKDLTPEETRRLHEIPVVEKHNGPVVRANGKELMNMTSLDVYNFNNNAEIKQIAIESVREYGVGSCGPAGFYGNQDAHVQCEEQIAKFLGTEGCILYAQGLATVSSVIPCFMKRCDVIVADENVNLGIQKGMLMSRASLYWYKHNDMADLEQTLIRANKSYRRGPIPRRFIVTEGVFETVGDSPDLKKIVELKKKYKYRLLLDETFSLGILGDTGRGLVEEAGVSRDDVEISLGILSGTFGSAGGFCAGRKTMVEHQRITSLSYTFSATMPPYLAKSTTRVLEYLEDAEFVNKHCHLIRKKSQQVCDILKTNRAIKIVSRTDVPTVFIQFASKTNTPDLLERVAEICEQNGVFISRQKRLPDHESFAVDPAIKLYINNDLTVEQLKQCAKTISQAFTQA